ncbi:MAG: transcriptional regulator [Cytophagales bacterium]|nr:MAG: transcriptional regulator [Cytophagales bacterium]TAF62047.1 MAG: transcriptional regulator [Cytophagales bacterium]
MTLDEAKKEFIETWGGLASQWGIGRAMAQLHALLYISDEPLCTEDIMEKLVISRGSANMNVRELMDWGLVRKLNRVGERRDFYEAEKDVWKIASCIMRERKKRELEPILQILEKLSQPEDQPQTASDLAFLESIKRLKDFSESIDAGVNTFLKAEENRVTRLLMSILGKK